MQDMHLAHDSTRLRVYQSTPLICNDIRLYSTLRPVMNEKVCKSRSVENAQILSDSATTYVSRY